MSNKYLEKIAGLERSIGNLESRARQLLEASKKRISRSKLQNPQYSSNPKIINALKAHDKGYKMYVDASLGKLNLK